MGKRGRGQLLMTTILTTTGKDVPVIRIVVRSSTLDTCANNDG
jgi:hypothetical protein